jgi:predicted nucleic acid-binding protein
MDSSAVARVLRHRVMRDRWERQITSGLVAICPAVELELLYSARSSADRADLAESLRVAFGWVPMPERAFERALEVQARLTSPGTHRSAGPVDLLVAATAEAHRLVLIHHDRDFEQIAQVTGQPTTWLVEPGSVP